MWRAPAFLAALCQLLSFAVMAGVAQIFARRGYALPAYGAAFGQGVLAASLMALRRPAPWWYAMALTFPIGLFGMRALHPPPLVPLAVFLGLLAMYWSTFRTQVPFFPTGPPVWAALAKLLPASEPVRLIDIGSGVGGLVLDLARRRPADTITGIELAPLPWLVSLIRARLTGSSARFVRGDYARIDFAAYDVVFAYLSPAAMTALWQKAGREMHPGSMLVSFEFAIAGNPPNATIAPTAAGPSLYLWRF